MKTFCFSTNDVSNKLMILASGKSSKLKSLSKKNVEDSPTLIIYGPLNISLMKHD